MISDELITQTEALLFASGDPVSTDRLCSVLEIDHNQAEEAIAALSQRLEKSQSALMIVHLDDSWQMTTKSEHAKIIRKLLEIRYNAPLSSAALEVLAVVAYNQPVTKSFIEQVRGVDCSGVVSSLVEKGIIEEKGRLELPGRPLLYGTTMNFLRCFGISSLEELPPLPQTDEQKEEITVDNNNA